MMTKMSPGRAFRYGMRGLLSELPRNEAAPLPSSARHPTMICGAFLLRRQSLCSVLREDSCGFPLLHEVGKVARRAGWGAESRAFKAKFGVTVVQSDSAAGHTPSGAPRHLPQRGWGREAPPFVNATPPLRSALWRN